VWSTLDSNINHIDGNGLNNKIENLELVPRNKNLSDLNRKVSKNNKSTGVRGIYIHNGKFQVVYKSIYRGKKDTLEEGKELWSKCHELDEQGIVYKETTRKNKRK
jgi:hypothetical protein